jgi:hypothetical protein
MDRPTAGATRALTLRSKSPAELRNGLQSAFVGSRRRDRVRVRTMLTAEPRASALSREGP